jgi:hypothetical protein
LGIHIPDIHNHLQVTTSIYNLILGKLYVDHYGTMRIQGNRELSIKLKFKEQSIIDRNPHQVFDLHFTPFDFVIILHSACLVRSQLKTHLLLYRVNRSRVVVLISFGNFGVGRFKGLYMIKVELRLQHCLASGTSLCTMS